MRPRDAPSPHHEGGASGLDTEGKSVPPEGSRCGYGCVPSMEGVQLALGYARLDDPPPSHAAARSLDPKRVGRQIQDVVVSIATHPNGAICAQVAGDLGRDRGNVARRITDAHRRGLVRRDGVRTAPSGRLQTVWKATSKGLELAAERIAETTS